MQTKSEYKVESYDVSGIDIDTTKKYLIGIENILLRSITNGILEEYSSYLEDRDIVDRTNYALERYLMNSNYLTVIQHKDTSLFCISRFEHFNPHKPYKGLVPSLVVCDGCDPCICFRLYKEIRRIAREQGCKWYAMSHRIAPFKYNFQYIDL